MRLGNFAAVLLLAATPVAAQGSLSPSLPSSPSSSSGALPSALSETLVESPGAASDGTLESIVRAAYTGAAAFALAHGNYFARDGVFPPLHDAVAAELATEGLGSVYAPADPSADLEAARVCRTAPGVELRIATNTYGDGVTLVAVSEARYFAYRYDPHEAAEIRVVAAADCTKPN